MTAEPMLAETGIARVAADPAVFDGAGSPGGFEHLAYFRLHGSPRLYRSDYSVESLKTLSEKADERAEAGAEVWCIFDNTTEGHAIGNALALDAMKRPAVRSR